MRISDRYIGKQVLLGTLYAVLVLGLVLVLGNLFKKVQPLLVEQKAPLELVLRFALSVLPLSLMYTIPWGFLSAVLLVFGRLSGNQEITSFRVAGVSLARLSVPVFVIAAMLSLLSLWLNVNVVPHSKASAFQLLYAQATRDPASLLKPGVIQGDLAGGGEDMQKLLVEGRSGDWVEGFHFYHLPGSEEDGRTYIHARRAALSVVADKSQLRIKLEDAYFESEEPDGGVEMAFAGRAEPLLIDLKNPRQKRMRASAMSNKEIREYLSGDAEIPVANQVKFRAELVQRYTFSMACLAFAFVAVPLGLGTRRKDSSGGLVISLAIGTAYFLVTMLAEDLESPGLSLVMLWAPNAACVLLGLWLFRRARFK